MFKLEFYQFLKQHRFVYLLFLLPILTLLGLGLYRGQVSHDLALQERQQANRLSSDLNWSISLMQGQGVPDDDPQLQALKDAEKVRFDYSVAAFYHEWDRVNRDKLSLWQTLLDLNDQGKDLLSISRQQLEAELPVIQWQVDYRVGAFDPKTTRESSYLLSQVSPYLLGLPLLLLFVYLVGMPLLKDLFENQQAFLKTLPVSYGRLIGRRFAIFLSIGVLYGLSVLAGWGVYHVLFDRLSLIALLHYPLASGWPLWQGVLMALAFWLLQALIVWLLLLILNRRVQNSLLVWLGLSIVMTLVTEFIRLFQFYPTYFILSYWDIQGFISHQTGQGIVIALLVQVLLFLALSGLAVKLAYVALKRGREHPQWELSSRRFLAGFEWLKVLRGNLWWQLLAGLLAFCLYYGVSQGIQYQQLREANIARESEMLNVDLPAYRSAYPSEELYQQALTFQERQTALIEELKKGQTALATADEYDMLKRDVDYLLRQSDMSQLPVRDWIFMPNAYINYQIVEWKRAHGIEYQVPGGPYWTLYLPTYEQSPRSGENEPPLAIDIAVFEAYLARVSKPMRSYTALGMVGNLVQDRLYLGLCALLVLFLVAPVVMDRETGRWKFQAIQPVEPVRLLTLRRRLTLQQIGVLSLLVVLALGVAGLLIAGWGHADLPFVRYLVNGQQWTGFVGQRWQVPSTHQYFELLPSWYYYLEAAGLLAALTYFLNSLCHAVARLVQSTALYVTLVASVIALGYGVTQLLPSLAQVLSPFRYLDLPPILDGQAAVALQQPLLTHWMGMLVCGMAGLLLNTFVRFTMKGRDRK